MPKLIFLLAVLSVQAGISKPVYLLSKSIRIGHFMQAFSTAGQAPVEPDYSEVGVRPHAFSVVGVCPVRQQDWLVHEDVHQPQNILAKLQPHYGFTIFVFAGQGKS
jgi:hypothetical protein